jgi:hypothetical protein
MNPINSFRPINANRGETETSHVQLPTANPEPPVFTHGLKQHGDPVAQQHSTARVPLPSEAMPDRGWSHTNDEKNKVAGERSSTIPQVAPAPYILPSQPSFAPKEDDPKYFAFKNLQKLQVEHQKLKEEMAARAARIVSFEQIIGGCSIKRDRIKALEEDEIGRAVREIRERYRAEHEGLTAELAARTLARQKELEDAEKANIKIIRKEEGIKRYRDLIEYCEADEDDMET